MKTQLSFIQTCILAIVVSTLFTFCSSPTPPGISEEDKVFFQKATVDAYESYTNDHDTGPYLARYASDALHMGPHRKNLVGIEAISAHVNSLPHFQLAFPIEEMWGSGDLVNIRGTFTIKDLEGTLTDKGKYISIWQRSNEGKWEITHDIFNSDLPLPESAPEDNEVTAER